MTTEQNANQTGAYVHANGIDICYEVYGSGYPLLLIHGASADHTMWEQQIPFFAQHFRVIAPDVRGHGRTKNPHGTMSYRLFADDMAALIQALGLQQPLVCGYSLGGRIVLEMGMNYPHLAKSYVIGGTAYKPSQQWEPIIRRWGIDAPGVVDMERLQRENPGIYENLLTYQGAYQGVDYCESYMRQLSYMWTTPWHYIDEELQKISVPSLIMVGDRDGFFPVEQALHMYRTLPNAELSIFPGADHGFIWPRAELFCATIIDFLLRHSPPDALEKAQ